MTQDDSQRTFRDEMEGEPAAHSLLVTSDRARQELDDGNVGVALLLAATEAEARLIQKLQIYFEVYPQAFGELCGNMSLGSYLGICNKNDLVHKEFREPLNNLINKRSNLAHDFGYFIQLEEDTEEREKVREIVSNCCDWFDSD